MSETAKTAPPAALGGTERGSARLRARRNAVLRRFLENRLAVAGLFVIVLFYAIAIAAPAISRYDYKRIQGGARNRPPSTAHWLGTDRSGRDVYARLIMGTRVSLTVGFVAMVIIMTVGTVLGATAGFFGGWVDTLLMRLTDILQAVPQILLLIAAAALFRASLKTTVIVIGLTSWPGAARIVRGQFLALKGQEFVTAARASGATPLRIMVRHLFPNALAVMIVEATLLLSTTILLEAALSYLGLGVQIPTPSWGNMLQDGQRDLLAGAWWMTVFPGMAIFLTVLAFNLMGDGLRDALDPRQRRR
ncbi:MAG: ABC transporter permease [Chloroflexota bacterium]|nr:ABC transporter permease [Chloroflexota bacterium]